MSFGYSGKKDDVSMKLRAQNMKNARKQTSQLEVDSRKMEERLQELKLAMNNEKEEREKHQGGFWQTGQEGNLGNYANEVLSKPNKQERNKEKKKKVIKVLKDEPIVTPERNKGPGTYKYIADKRPPVGKENKIKGSVCGQCEAKSAHVSCLECGEDYCASCFAAFHMKGALKKHRSVPVGATGSRTPRPMATMSGDNRNTHSPPYDERATPTDVNLIMDSSRSSARSSARLSANSTSSYSSNNRSIVPHPPSAPKQPSPPQSSHPSKNNISPPSYDQNPLLDGAYDEREAAMEFQRALAEWRSGKKEQVQKSAISHADTPVYSTDEGTGTDTIFDSQQQPVDIKFHGTLSYAEKLMLKRHRRLELGPSSSEGDLSLSPTSSSSALIIKAGAYGISEEDIDNRPSIFSSVEVLDQDALGDKSHIDLASSRVDVNVLLGSVKRPHGDKYEHDRSESSLSIIELNNADDTEGRVQYRVTEVNDDDVLPPPTPSALAMTKSNRFWKSREAFKTPHTSAKLPRTQSPNASIDTPKKSRKKWKQEDSLENSYSIKVEPENDQINSSQIYDNSKPPTASARKAVGSRPASGMKSRPQSRMKSARGNQRPKSRAESRLSLFGEGVLTKEPSPALKEIAQLANQLTTEIMSNSEYKLGLGEFFTAGVESPVKDMDVERTLTPTKNRPVSARSRPQSGRPKSRAGGSKNDDTGIEKWKISNKLYSMTPRSWKPDFSLGDTVSDTQAENHLNDQDVLNMDRLAEETMASIARERACDDDMVLAEMNMLKRHEKSRPITMQSVTDKPVRPKSKTGRVTPVRPPSRPTTASGRESRMIVMEGEDLSLYDHVEETDNMIQDDNEALDQLEWELASESGRLTAEGRISRMMDETDDYEEELHEEVPGKKPKDIGFDIQNHLRASELMDDFEEMEAAIMEEEEVKRLM